MQNFNHLFMHDMQNCRTRANQATVDEVPGFENREPSIETPIEGSR